MGLQYIGVTGFKSREQIFDVHARSGINTSQCSDNRHHLKTPSLMCGVLVSKKTFLQNDFSGSFSGRYVTREELRKLFYEHPDLINLVHYNSDSLEEGLFEELMEIMIFADGGDGGSNCSGFQLNLGYIPNLSVIDKIQEVYEHDLDFVLQINSRILDRFENNPSQIANHLKIYGSQCSFLLDFSGGTSKDLDVELSVPYIDAFAQVGITTGLGVAGGLSADSLEPVSKLLEKYPYLSIDAEGKLHDLGPRGGVFNPEKAKRYVSAAVELYQRLK